MQLKKAVLKICIEEFKIEKLDFELVPIKTYLYKKIKASSLFNFDKENEHINVYIDNPLNGDFLNYLETD